MKKYPDEKEKYPNKEKINKERVAAKVKSIRSGFKKQLIAVKKVIKVAWFSLFSIIVTICGMVAQLLQI